MIGSDSRKQIRELPKVPENVPKCEDVHLIVKTRTLIGVTSTGSNLTIISEKLDRLFDFFQTWAARYN